MISSCFLIPLKPIYRSSFEDYIYSLSNVLKRISHTGLEISLKKCNIYERKFKLLGHVVFENGFLVIEAIKDWTTQWNVKDLRSFWGEYIVLPSFYEKTR